MSRGEGRPPGLLILMVAALGSAYLLWVFWSLWYVFLGLAAVAVFLVGLARCLEWIGQSEVVRDAWFESRRWWRRQRGRCVLCGRRVHLDDFDGPVVRAALDRIGRRTGGGKVCWSCGLIVESADLRKRELESKGA